MPVMLKVRVNPAYKPQNDDEKQALAAAKKVGTKELPYVTAMENVANSKGLYEIVPNDPGPAEVAPPRMLEDMSIEELKVMMLQTGVTPQKVMTKEQVIKSIRLKLAAVEITDEG